MDSVQTVASPARVDRAWCAMNELLSGMAVVATVMVVAVFAVTGFLWLIGFLKSA